MADRFPLLRVNYDEICDTLYLSLGEPQRAVRCEEDSQGIIWRISQSGKTEGATVQAAHQLWANRYDELVCVLQSHLSEHAPELRSRVLAAL